MSIRKEGSSGGARKWLSRIRMFWTLNSSWNAVVNLYCVVSLIAREVLPVEDLPIVQWGVIINVSTTTTIKSKNTKTCL